MTKKLIITINDKGGVGKSTTQLAIVSLLRSLFLRNKLQKELKVAAYSADGKNTVTLKYYANGETYTNNSLKDIKLYPITTHANELLNLLDECIELEVSHIPIDFPAACLENIQNIIGNPKLYLDEFNNEGFKPLIVVPISSTEDSARSLVNTINAFGPEWDYLALLNKGLFGINNNQSVYETKIYETSIESYINQAMELTNNLEIFEFPIIEDIDKLRTGYFYDGLFDSSNPAFKTIDRATRARLLNLRNELADSLIPIILK